MESGRLAGLLARDNRMRSSVVMVAGASCPAAGERQIERVPLMTSLIARSRRYFCGRIKSMLAARLLLAIAPWIPAMSQAQRMRVELQSESPSVSRAGLVVVVVNERDSTVAQGLSNASGVRTFALARAGTYRAVVRRIGYLPIRSDPLTLAAGGSVTVRLALPAEHVTLAPITVTTGRKECSAQPANALAAALVWEQIRT